MYVVFCSARAELSRARAVNASHICGFSTRSRSLTYADWNEGEGGGGGASVALRGPVHSCESTHSSDSFQ